MADTSNSSSADVEMEFHDSTVAAAKSDGPIVTIEISPAYIYRPSECWTRPIYLWLTNGLAER